MRLPIMQVSVDTRKLASFAIVAFLMGGALGGLLFNYGGVYMSTSNLSNMFGYMNQFQSYDELKEYLTVRNSYDGYWGFPMLGRGFSDVMVMEEAVTLSGGNSEIAFEVTGTAPQADGGLD